MAEPPPKRPRKDDADFKFVCETTVSGIPIEKYTSQRTGLRIVLAQVEGPLVNGYFPVATEAHDDDGLPHTLEHLIFVGSEEYPQKGVLDLVASRCLGTGTNATTEIDHTCFTMATAGNSGFLGLMPIFLDHILFPKLGESAFITEVHHVTSKGEDAGVVYSEMQGTENNGDSMSYRKLLQSIYPGDCGYKAETGGLLKNLRESTNNEKVKAFHRTFYRPENLTLIIAGQIDAADVFRSLKQFQDKVVVENKEREAFVRPWQNPVPPLKDSVDELILYPSDEEGKGMVHIGWRGPSVVNDLYRVRAYTVLFHYLTQTSVSPLQKSFVEIDDPFCSKVTFSKVPHSECLFYLKFENVPASKLNDIKAHLMEVLQSINIEMERIATIIQRQMLSTRRNFESNPGKYIARSIITDMLYGNTIENLNQMLNEDQDLQKIRAEDDQFWINLIKDLIKTPSVTICANSSKEEQERRTNEEKERIEEQKKKLGEDGLKRKGEELKNAIEENKKPLPKEMVTSITSIAFPSISSLKFHPVSSFTTKSEKTHPQFDISKVPVYFQLDDIHTNFVYLTVLMNTSQIPKNLRPYLPLFIETLLETPVKRGDANIPHEDIVRELEADTTDMNFGLGLGRVSSFTCGPYAQTACLYLQVTPTKYERGIKWLNELLFHTVFTHERLKVIATRMANDLFELKMEGDRLVSGLMRGLRFSDDSNHYASDMMQQEKFLADIIGNLEKVESAVIPDLEKIRETITSPGNIAIHMAANVKDLAKFGNPAEPWKNFLPEGVPAEEKKMEVVPDRLYLSEEKKKGVVLGLGSEEAAYLSCTTPCAINDNHPDLPALLVLLQYLSQPEGPLWREIRGPGFSYSYSIRVEPNEGLLYFNLDRSADVISAFKAAMSLAKTTAFDPLLLTSAKNSLIYELVEEEGSVNLAVGQSLLSHFRSGGPHYNRNLMRAISEIENDDLTRVAPTYLPAMFDTTHARITIVCNAINVDEILQEFGRMGFELVPMHSK